LLRHAPLASAKTRPLSQSEVSGGLELVGFGPARLLKLDSIPSLEVDACSCARAVVSVFAGGPTIAALS
jgi:hypothetical protein